MLNMSKRKALTGQELKAIASEIDLDEESGPEDFDSDDSVRDPDYNTLTSSDESSCEENIDEVIQEDEDDDQWEDDQNDDIAAPSNQDENPTNATWTEYVGRHKQFTFTGRTGIQKNIADDVTPLDVFNLLVDEDILRLIVTETNRFAEQLLVSKRKTKHARHNKWTPTTVDEIKKFLGLTMWMGLVRLSSLADYWANQGIYKQYIPSTIMSRNRYQMLLSMLHFNNNETIQKGDRLAKIEPLCTVLERKFKELFFPGEDIVIDETLVPWRGRLIFRQYIPNKTHRYGIKLFKLCSTEGYTWALKIYAGKSKDGVREVGLAQNVCMELTGPLLNDGRTLYIDNFYTSYSLAKSMLANATHVVGTLRANKKDIPKEVMLAKLKRGEVISKEDENGIVVLKWKDTRDVRMLSTKHAPTMVEIEPKPRSAQKSRDGDPKPSTSHDDLPLPTVATTQSQPDTFSDSSDDQPLTIHTRNSHTHATNNQTQPSTSKQNKPKKKARKATKKPLAILAYNKGKGGIDLSDQMASYVTTLRKGIKWYRKLGLELLLGVAVVNTWVVYKKVTKNKMSIRATRESLVEELLQIAERKKQNTKRKSSVQNTHHLAEKINDKGKRIRRSCAGCYARIKLSEGREVARKRTKMVHTYCVECPDQPFQCLSCFNLTHT